MLIAWQLTDGEKLVNLMRGDIALDSKLGQGTTASFWIPFNRAPYQDDGPPLIDLASIPDRLQSDMSVSCGSSEDLTPPRTPTRHSKGAGSTHARSSSQQFSSSPAVHASVPDRFLHLPDSEREKIHVLVVEDKSVTMDSPLFFVSPLIACFTAKSISRSP